MATGEVEAAIYWVREVAKRRLPVEVIEDTEQHIVEVHHTPLGVVGAITPWNFPVLLGLWKIAPCLITGNTMVMKPSPYTPLCTLRFGEIAQGIFPAGVLNIVSGGNELGQLMTEHPDIAKISFTGSTATGKKVMASGAVNLKRITLELGGNDPAIILPDADYKSLIPGLFWAAFGNSGQWCIAIKRLCVHSSINADFVREFTAYAAERIVGDGMEPRARRNSPTPRATCSRSSGGRKVDTESGVLTWPAPPAALNGALPQAAIEFGPAVLQIGVEPRRVVALRIDVRDQQRRAIAGAGKHFAIGGGDDGAALVGCCVFFPA